MAEQLGEMDRTRRIHGVNWVSSRSVNHSAYHSKLAGIVGTLYATAVLVHHYSITSGALTITLDGEAAVDGARGDWPLKVTKPCADLIQEIFERTCSLPIAISWRWVCGHQYEKGFTSLDWWACMNDEVDAATKTYMTRCLSALRLITTPSLLYERWFVSVNNSKFSWLAKDALYKALITPQTHTYLETHQDLPLCIPNATAINWEPSRLALIRLTQFKRTGMFKLVTGLMFG